MTPEQFDAVKDALNSADGLADLMGWISKIRAHKATLDNASKRVKELDDMAKGRLLNLLNVQGLKTANVAGVGTVTATCRQQAQIRDFEKVAAYIAKAGAEATAAGRPVSDILAVLQRRAALNTVQGLQEAGVDLAEIGIELVDVNDVSIKLAK